VGKTAFTAMLARALVEKNSNKGLLLIDADPALGLTNALGVKVEKTIGQVRETIIETARSGDDADKKEISDSLDYMIMESMVEGDDFSLIAMGRSESQGCFCPVNNLLRDSIELLSKKFHTILIDGEAGLEQINRQVVSELDSLLLLTDGSARGLQTVEVLKSMVEDDKVVKCGNVGVVFNRAALSDDFLINSADGIGINVFGIIPQNSVLAEYDAKGISLRELPQDNPAYESVKGILNKLK
jgi:CO dehydrogenase maturation factor